MQEPSMNIRGAIGHRDERASAPSADPIKSAWNLLTDRLIRRM
jgi:hypothetical protein